MVFSLFRQSTKKNKRSKNTAICDTFTNNMSEMLYFTVFLDHLPKNTGIYSVL